LKVLEWRESSEIEVRPVKRENVVAYLRTAYLKERI